MRFRPLLAFALLSIATVTGPALAAEPAPVDAVAAQAAKLKQEGTDAYNAKDWEVALVKFQEAYALTKEPSFLYNKARTLESMGELPRALDAIEEFDKAAPPDLKAKVNGLEQVIAGIRARVATLVIRSNVVDAEVRINDRVVSKTKMPEVSLRVKVGSIKIDLVSPDYFPCSLTINDLRGGEVRAATCELGAKNIQGMLVIDSVEGSQISVDGREVGTGSYEGYARAGAHEIVITKSGSGTYRTSVLVRAGEKRPLKVSALPSPPVTSRWWFWTTLIGGAVVIAGGTVATIIALNTERSPDSGTILPGKVSTGGFRF